MHLAEPLDLVFIKCILNVQRMHIALTAVWGKRHGIFVEPTNESCGSDWKDWLLNPFLPERLALECAARGADFRCADEVINDSVRIIRPDHRCKRSEGELQGEALLTLFLGRC